MLGLACIATSTGIQGGQDIKPPFVVRSPPRSFPHLIDLSFLLPLHGVGRVMAFCTVDEG